MIRKIFLTILCVLTMSITVACSSSTQSNKELKEEAGYLYELQEKIEELQNENKVLSREIEDMNRNKWKDDYIIPFTDEDMVNDVKKLAGVTDRDITYGDVKNITEFTHKSYYYSDLAPLRFFTSLEKLTIDRSLDEDDLNGIEHLANLSHLKEIVLWGSNNSYGNLDFLMYTGNLEKLQIKGCDYLPDLKGLKYAKNLKYLQVWSSNIENIDDLQYLNNLEELHWSNSEIPNIEVVKNMKNLKVLEVGGAGIDDEVIEKLNDKSNSIPSTNQTSHPDEEELNELLVELQAKNEALKEIINANSHSENNNAENSESWADDYVINFVNRQISSDVKKMTGITERPITYGDVKYITKYSLHGITGLSDLRYFTSLTNLELEADSYNNYSLDGLENLTKLRTLVINGGCTDISALGNMVNMQRLYIRDCEYLKDITAISNMANLKTLYIGQLENLTNIDPISNATNLQTLEINHLENLTNIDALSNLTNLNELQIAQCHGIRKINVLSNLKELTTLKIIRCDYIDIVDLYEFTNLNNLTEIEFFILKDFENIHIESMDELKDFLENRDTNKVNDVNNLFTAEEIDQIVASMEELVQMKLTNVTIHIGLNIEYCDKVDGELVITYEDNGGTPIVYVKIESDQGTFEGYADKNAACIVPYIG